MLRIITLAVFIFSCIKAKPQGCSDAGFCTINSFKPSKDTRPGGAGKNQLRAGISTGSADHDITVFSALLEYSRQINNSFSVDTKVAMISQSGNGIQSAGLSDIFVNVNYAVS